MIYVCYTRKLKYRCSSCPASPFGSYVYNSVAISEYEYNKGGREPGLAPETREAPEFEVCSVDPERQYGIDDMVRGDDAGLNIPGCLYQHTRELWFDHSYRQPLIEGEQYQFYRPRAQLQDSPDEKGDIEGEGKGEVVEDTHTS